MQLVKDYKFPSLFINQFFPRPGTPAAKMPRVPPQQVRHSDSSVIAECGRGLPDVMNLQVKMRTKRITEVFQSYRTYDHKVGRVETVLVTETSHDGNYYVAHNKCYDQVSLWLRLHYSTLKATETIWFVLAGAGGER